MDKGRCGGGAVPEVLGEGHAVLLQGLGFPLRAFGLRKVAAMGRKRQK